MYEDPQQRGPWSIGDLDRRYVRVDSPEHRQLVADVNALKSEMAETKSSAWRTERYLVGGLDDDGRYTMGMSAVLKIVAILLGLLVAVMVPVAAHIFIGLAGKP